MSQPANRFNKFGAKIDKFLTLFPSGGISPLQSCDFGGDNVIKDCQSRQADNILSLLRPDVKNKLIAPQYQIIVRPGMAQAGQTTFTLPFSPVLNNSWHFWRRPIYQGYYNAEYGDYYDQSFWGSSGAPKFGVNEIPLADLTVTAATGAVVLGGSSSPLTSCEQVIASYRVDVDDTDYLCESAAGWVNYMAAAELGAVIYDRNSSVYSIVEMYQKKAMDLTEGLMKGILIPSECLYEVFYYELERNSRTISSTKAIRT